MLRDDEISVDIFCGAGGTSEGYKAATGKQIDIAINHSPKAIAVHTNNNPNTKHYQCDVYEVDPLEAVQGRPVGFLWASPDCKHFSRAKGKKPLDNNIRSLAWVVTDWAEKVSPRIIMMENVEEFTTWGPLDEDGGIIKSQKGETFNLFINKLKSLGYEVEWKVLQASDYGVHTIRTRFYLIARRDNQPIKWPEEKYGDPKKFPERLPWKTSGEIIDFSLPIKSIFDRKKPLADKTKKRIYLGIKKFVLEDPEPFIISIANWSSISIRGTSEPLSTITANPKGGHHALVVAFLSKYYTGVVGSSCKDPIGTITAIDHNALVNVNLSRLIDHHDRKDNSDKVAAFLLKYYGNEKGGVSLKEPFHTITSKERFALVVIKINGEDYVITDIGLRMVAAKELYLGQGFEKDYKFTTDAEGNNISKTDQVKHVGNSVCPKMAKLLIGLNL